MIRENFNADWRFIRNPVISVQSHAHADAAEGVPVTLPHDAMIHETRSASAPSQNQTGFYPGGRYCYRKVLHVPESWRDEHILLEFEGSYRNTTVSINGTTAAAWENGYTEVVVDTDDLLRYGQDNVIQVMVNNEGQPSSRWYSGSGLYRNVNLLRGGRVHIGTDGVRVKTVYTDGQVAMLNLRIPLVNQMIQSTHCTMNIRVADAGGATITRDSLPLYLKGSDGEVLCRTLQVHDPRLWDCDHPHLYTCEVTLTREDEVLDAETIRFGIRTLAMDSRRGLLLNGQPVKLRGACIHHDNGILGACAFPEAESRRVRIMKEAGFNCIRSSHNPTSRALLDACDEQGMLVMDEYADMWMLAKNAHDDAFVFTRQWQDDLAALVRKDYNHPSVILYCLGNEIPEASTDHGARLCRQMDTAIKVLDDSRLTTTSVNALLSCSSRIREIMGDIMRNMPRPAERPRQEGDKSKMDGVSQTNSFASIMHGPLGDAMLRHRIVTEMLTPYKNATDITGLNYMPARYALEKELCPDRLVLGTEEYPADIADLWALVEQYPHVIGDMTWTGWDYLGEAGIGIFYYDGTVNFMPHWPDRAAYIGDIDILGDRRPISLYREVVYGLRKTPVIAVERLNHLGETPNKTAWMFKDSIASWTWHGYEGKEASVDVYCDAPEVELLLNGESLGVLPCGKDNKFTASFNVPYAPGTLEAYALRDGQRAEHFALTTADEAVTSVAFPEGEHIPADGLLFVPIRLVDAKGQVNHQAQREITVQAEGAARLIGFGSAAPSGETPYDGSVFPTYDGTVMAVLQGVEVGGASLTISDETGHTQTLTFPVK